MDLFPPTKFHQNNAVTELQTISQLVQVVQTGYIQINHGLEPLLRAESTV